MFKKTKKGYYFFEAFEKPKGLVHGFSSRELGDGGLKKKPANWPNVQKFLASLGLKKKNLVLMEQVHQNQIKVVTGKNRGEMVAGVDGLITTRPEVVLGVRTADCLPILLYDPVRKVIGAAHAGWKGVLRNIPQKMVEVMIRLGSLPEDILVGIGPHIAGCCYNIEAQRVERFRKKFNSPKGMIIEKKNEIYLDLVIPAVLQLVHTGVLRKNIYCPPTCTSCQNKEFFSYRKDSNKTYGEMLGVISLI